MPSRSIAPLELIPMGTVPSSDVLMAGIAQPPDPRERPYSDLFPEDDNRHFKGMLGDYRGGDPRIGHPLYVAIKGLRAAHNNFMSEEADSGGARTELTRRGKAATMLQGHIGRCIAKSYDNLASSDSPATAIQILAYYLEEREATCTAYYNGELDYHSNVLELLDLGEQKPTPSQINGIPVISARDFALALGKLPESPEVEREGQRKYATHQISTVRDRLVRVEFEYRSALALTKILKDAL